jgi:membrane protease YdiL (CAAX protease family)
LEDEIQVEEKMRKIFFDADQSVRNGWKILAYLFLMVVTDGLCLAILHVGSISPSARRFVPDSLLFLIGGLIAAAICLHFENESFKRLGLKLNRRFIVQFGIGLVCGAVLLGITAVVVWSLGGYHLVRGPRVDPILLFGSTWLLFVSAAFEEIVFRGYLFQRSVRGIGVMPAQVIFATLFVLAHLGAPGLSGAAMILPSSTIFLAAMMLGFCYLRTGSLALPIGVHMGWNWLQESLGFSVSGRTLKGFWIPVTHDRPDWLTGGAFGLEASMVSVSVLVVTVLFLMRWQGRAGARLQISSR